MKLHAETAVTYAAQLTAAEGCWVEAFPRISGHPFGAVQKKVRMGWLRYASEHMAPDDVALAAVQRAMERDGVFADYTESISFRLYESEVADEQPDAHLVHATFEIPELSILRNAAQEEYVGHRGDFIAGYNAAELITDVRERLQSNPSVPFTEDLAKAARATPDNLDTSETDSRALNRNLAELQVVAGILAVIHAEFSA